MQVSITTRSINSDIKFLHDHMSNHPIWDSRLLKAFEMKHLNIDDIRFVFSQYYLYSKNFTRYLSGLMANMENDYFRAKLSENLWEEGGGADPNERHSFLFHKFLTDSLGIDLDSVKYEAYSHNFVQKFLNQCINEDALESAALLSVGTEAIVPRLYSIMVSGMKKVGLSDSDLKFFHLHMECDDEHAETLEEILLDYKDHPNWKQRSLASLDYALNLRLQFFEEIFDSLRVQRVKDKLNKIQDKKSLYSKKMSESNLRFNLQTEVKNSSSPLYENKIEKHNIDFKVCRAPFPAEVIDARLLTIPEGRCNERHKHAHESVFIILKGKARIMVGDKFFDIGEGESIFVPRWEIHQSQNIGEGDLIIYAITDFYLTGSALIGNYNSTARMNDELN